ncbi:MAG: 2-dehydropantoate 2-reductase [Chloroflexi bacterium]|nr:2-dehydropantoate 2-reductase [Chloroflexota bacterium]MBU1746552.1 2-dehydropantoate 2-reductase [Chloroflexota bacterium]
MKIAILGSGGVGGYFGGLLARAGHDVTFIARGAHLAAIRAHGLQVKSVHGDFIVAPAQATDNAADVGPVELVLVTVKTTTTDEAARAIAPLVGPDTTVLSLQNGIDAAERIGAVVGMVHMLGGVIWVSSAIEAPGVIRQMSQFRRIVLGELDGRVTPRAQAIYEALESTGAAVELSENIHEVLWTKFVFIAALSGVGTVTRLPVGDYRDVPETRELLVRLMSEVKAIALASGVALDADVVDQALVIVDQAAPTLMASMQRDVVAGRPSELESMIDVIGRRGRELGVPTPAADMVYAALLPGEIKARASEVVRNA